MAKPVEFDPTKPLLVKIHREPNLSWTIEPSSDHKAKMANRVTNDLTKAQSHKNESAEDEWKRRRITTVDPPFKHSGHTSIVMREGETVRFETDPPFGFAVWLTRDANVSLETNPAFGTGPDDPFGWGGPQMSLPGGFVEGKVQGPVTQNGPADQRFYKVHAVIFHPGGPTWTDPDGICDR